MQDHLTLIYREEVCEMLALYRAEDIGVIPNSPLASGRLTRDWSELGPPPHDCAGYRGHFHGYNVRMELAASIGAGDLELARLRSD